MGLLQWLKHDLKSGLATLRDVGERAVSLRDAGESVERVLYDTEIARLVKDIQQLKETSTNLEAEMQEIREAE